MAEPADDQLQNLPANPEDRKAAVALSSLNDDLGSRGSSADQEALGKAMGRLEIAAGQGGNNNAGASAGQMKQKPEVKKVVKFKAEDVNLLVRELDLSKTKATELLKANDGDAKKAIQAFIATV